MPRKALWKRIAGVRLTIAIQVFSTLLVLAVGYFALERNLRHLTHSRQFVPVHEIKSTIQKIRAEVIGIAFVAFLAGLTLSRTISKQLKRLTKGIENIATGDINPTISASQSDEFIPLDTAIRKLTDSLNRFLHQSITDAIIMLDEAGIIHALNPTAEYLFGYEPEEIIGSPLSILFPDDDRNKTLYRSIFSPSNGRGGWGQQIPSTIINKEGEAISVRVSSFRVIEDGSKVIGLVVGVIDVREFKKVREEIERTDRLSSLGILVSGLAHEIKNPLGAIKGLIQLLNEDIPEESPKKIYYGTILNEVNRLDSLLKRLLEFASQKGEPKSPVNINSITEDLLFLLKGDIERKGILIQKEFSDGLPHISGNSKNISMAIMNIVKNAIEATPRGGKVYIRTEIKNNNLIISIENEGPMIKKEDMKRLFDPFYTTKENGTGLGLAISYQVVRAHNGHIKVREIDRWGIAFDISFPLDSRNRDIVD